MGGIDQTQASRSGNQTAESSAFEYYCFPRPFFDFTKESHAKGDDEDGDEDELMEAYEQEVGDVSSLCDKRADELPSHKWIGMRMSLDILRDCQRRATYTSPDNFAMHTYNDFHGYGLQELIENLLVAFNKEFVKKRQDESSAKRMWGIVAGMVHWLEDEFGAWLGCEDGDRIQVTSGLVGRAFLSSLNELDLAGMLKPDSEIKDLGLVVSMILEWSHGLADCGIEEDADFEWRTEVAAYAKRVGVDLAAVGCYGVKDNVDAVEGEYENLGPLTGPAIPERWYWQNNFASSGVRGGEALNILKMSRKERAEYAFDGKDPLKDFPAKQLREGLVIAYQTTA